MHGSGLAPPDEGQALLSSLAVIEHGVGLLEHLTARSNSNHKELHPKLEEYTARLNRVMGNSGSRFGKIQPMEHTPILPVHTPKSDPAFPDTAQKKGEDAAKLEALQQRREKAVAQRTKITALFKELDVNNSGTLNINEFSDAMEAKGIMSHADAAKLFTTLDENHDGTLDSAEFLSVMMHHEAARVHHEAARVHHEAARPSMGNEEDMALEVRCANRGVVSGGLRAREANRRLASGGL